MTIVIMECIYMQYTYSRAVTAATGLHCQINDVK